MEEGRRSGRGEERKRGGGVEEGRSERGEKWKRRGVEEGRSGRGEEERKRGGMRGRDDWM